MHKLLVAKQVLMILTVVEKVVVKLLLGDLVVVVKGSEGSCNRRVRMIIMIIILNTIKRYKRRRVKHPS